MNCPYLLVENIKVQRALRGLTAYRSSRSSTPIEFCQSYNI